jgi:predicted ATPase
MEKLRCLKVKGFRSLRELELELEDLTVLIGANGSGKSNFISFFNMLSFMLSGDLQTYIARKGAATSILHYGPKRTPILEAELEFEGLYGTSKYGFSLAFASPDRLIFTDEHFTFQNPGKSSPYELTLGSGQAETDLLGLSGQAQESTARKVARIFIHRLRGLQVYHFHDTSEEAYIRTSQDIGRNHFLMGNGGNLASILYMLREKWPGHFDRIVSTVRLAVPYLKDLILEPDRLDPKSVQMRWRDRNPDYEFGAHQLSDGSLRAIAIITALLQPEEMLPTVILIDEPELGLHPGAIAVVASLIKTAAAKRQVIISTQSSRLMAEFAPENVVVVERHEDDRGFGESSFERLSREELGAWLDQYDLGALFEMNVTGGGPL